MHLALRRLLLPLLSLATLAAALPAHAGIYVYNAVLDARQEPGAIVSSGKGAGRFIIDTDANTVTYRITYTGLTGAPSAGHIHGAAAGGPGINSGVVHSFVSAANPIVGVWSYTEAQESMILQGRCYANIHTAANPGGEIRGQIAQLNAQLDGAQEGNAATGTGWAVANVDTATNTLSYYVAYSGLTGAVVASHLHGYALHGVAAGVKIGITAGASPMSGSVSYLEADEAALLAGRMYINLHTGAFPGGEIRGQLVPTVVPIDNGQEGTTATNSSGYALVALDTTSNTLSYDVRVNALTGAELASHIHGYSTLPTPSGVVAPLPAGTQKLGSWAYGAANAANVLAGLTYFNFHTAANGGGEIGGQISYLPRPFTPVVVGVTPGGPRVTSGLAAAPNPFGTRTVLSFQLARTGSVSLAIVGVDGRTVRSVPAVTYAPGSHSFEWDGLDNAGRPAAPGVYFAVIRTPDGERTTRLARLR